MGFADMLIKLEVSYGSKKSLDLAVKLMKFIRKESLQASAELAKERGTFPSYKKSIYAKRNLKLRNATVNTIAPTGSISIIAGCSSGIEPLFAVSFMRNILSGTQLFEINPLFEKKAKEKGFYNKKILSDVIRAGSIKRVKGIPENIKRAFLTAFDIAPESHLKMQAAFQKYTDNSVSKTINLPRNAKVKDIKKIYMMAHKLKCKGITIYRYGSKKDQVLSFGSGTKKEALIAGAEYSGGCVSRKCAF
jgi:ribonucleoside-diphosphate reductase alpha chain